MSFLRNIEYTAYKNRLIYIIRTECINITIERISGAPTLLKAKSYPISFLLNHFRFIVITFIYYIVIH